MDSPLSDQAIEHAGKYVTFCTFLFKTKNVFDASKLFFLIFWMGFRFFLVKVLEYTIKIYSKLVLLVIRFMLNPGHFY